MPQRNVEIVRRAIDAFNRRDLDAAARDSDPKVEVDWSRSLGVEAAIYQGRDDVRGFWNTFLDMFERIVVYPDEFIERGEHVVVPNRTRMWGRDGIEVEARSVLVVTLRDGRILKWRLYQERDDALAAVGMSE